MKTLAAFAGFGVILSLAGCGTTTIAQGVLFNDDFSDPKLTGWTTLGSAGLRTNAEVIYDNIEVRLYESPRQQDAAPGSWTRKADMPLALDTHGSCALDGILYVIGGHKEIDVYTQLPTLFAYDPKTDVWTRKADMPTARRFVAACALDGIVYAIGGGGLIDTPPTDAVEAYDPKTDIWATRARLASPRFTLSACAVDGVIYAIGGAIGATFDTIQALTKVETYDPKTDQWTPKANLPTPVLWGAATVVDGIIYVFSRKETFAYAPRANRWTRKAPIPAWSLYSLFSTCSVAEGIVYLFGGAASDGQTTFDLALAYDPGQDKFTAKRKLPMTCEAAACATIGGKIYHTGGANQDPFVRPAGAAYYESLWVFDPRGGVIPQILSLTREGNDAVRLVWRGEPGRLYGVQSTSNPAKGPWARIILSPGSNTILATNALVEATCPVSSADPKRFFRIFEAN